MGEPLDKSLEEYPLAQTYGWKTPDVRGLMFVYPPQVKFGKTGKTTLTTLGRHSLEALDPGEFSEPAMKYAKSIFNPYYIRNRKAGEERDETYA